MTADKRSVDLIVILKNSTGRSVSIKWKKVRVIKKIKLCKLSTNAIIKRSEQKLLYQWNFLQNNSEDENESYIFQRFLQRGCCRYSYYTY